MSEKFSKIYFSKVQKKVGLGSDTLEKFPQKPFALQYAQGHAKGVEGHAHKGPTLLLCDENILWNIFFDETLKNLNIFTMFSNRCIK
jgi:hypothetical protein